MIVGDRREEQPLGLIVVSRPGREDGPASWILHPVTTGPAIEWPLHRPAVRAQARCSAGPSLPHEEAAQHNEPDAGADDRGVVSPAARDLGIRRAVARAFHGLERPVNHKGPPTPNATIPGTKVLFGGFRITASTARPFPWPRLSNRERRNHRPGHPRPAARKSAARRGSFGAFGAAPVNGHVLWSVSNLQS